MPKMISSSHPVTTGGSTIGRCTSAFNSVRPGKRHRVSTQAARMASGKPNPTALAATDSVSQTASHSSDESNMFSTLKPRFINTRGVARSHHGNGSTLAASYMTTGCPVPPNLAPLVVAPQESDVVKHGQRR